MNGLKKILVLSVTLLLLTGCQYYKNYGFKPAEVKITWGSVRAKLLGTSNESFTHATSGSPYRLGISIGSKKFSEGIVYISELKLVDAKTRKIYFEELNTQEAPIEHYDDDHFAFFHFKNIELKHVDLLLHMNILLKQGDKLIRDETEIFFEADYQNSFRLISH